MVWTPNPLQFPSHHTPATGGERCRCTPVYSMAAVPDLQAQMESKANFSQIWGDDCLSDFTITIKAPAAAGAPQPPPQEQAAASASGSGSTGRVYATIPAHAAVLAQRFEYFSRMLRADMKEYHQGGHARVRGGAGCVGLRWIGSIDGWFGSISGSIDWCIDRIITSG